MELQALFPRWRAASDGGERTPWTLEVDLDDTDAFAALLAAVVSAQDDASRTSYQARLADAMVRDVVDLIAAVPAGRDPVDLEYLQFQIELGPFLSAMGGGDFGGAHDWILNGLSATIDDGVQRVIQTDRVERFLASPRAWIVFDRAATLTVWGAAFYYYCRVRAALHEAAQLLAPHVLMAVVDLPREDRRALEALGMMLNWAVEYRQTLARNLTVLLLRIFERSADRQVRTKISSVFATSAGAFSGYPPRHWAGFALDTGGDLLSAHERFQLFLVQVETEADWNRLQPRVLDAVATCAAEIAALVSPTAILRATNQRSGLLKPAFLLMNRFNRGGDLLELLATWYGVPSAARLRGGVLFVCATYEHGATYLGAQTQLIAGGGEERIVELTTLGNAMLGLTVTIQGVKQEMIAPERLAHPDPRFGARFAAAITRTYAFSQVSAEVMAGRRSLIAFPGQPHPLQAVMAAERGGSLPISASLEEPRLDRPIRKALLWGAGNDFYSSFEIDAVAVVLARAGVEIDVRSGDGASARDFLDAFSDPSFDLIWFAGHGEINHWHDGSAQLVVGDHCRLEIDSLHAAAVVEGGRRLVVLNICDGGASATNDGIQKLGLAPSLANSRQAVISHLWPVNPLAASAFGVSLADALATRALFHAAFDQALMAIRVPLPEVADHIRTIVPGAELVDRLENADLDTENVLQWGSPCFFQ